MRLMHRFEFDAAHRVAGSPVCGTIHGHRYSVKLTSVGAAVYAAHALVAAEVQIRAVFENALVLWECDPAVAAMREIDTRTLLLDVGPTLANLVEVIGKQALEVFAEHRDGHGVRLESVDLQQLGFAIGAEWRAPE